MERLKQRHYDSINEFEVLNESTYLNNNISVNKDGENDYIDEIKIHPAAFKTSAEIFMFRIARAARIGWNSAATTAATTPTNDSIANTLLDTLEDDNQNEKEENTFETQQQERRNARRKKKSVLLVAFLLICVSGIMALCLSCSASSSSCEFSFHVPYYAELFGMSSPTLASVEGLNWYERKAQGEAEYQRRIHLQEEIDYNDEQHENHEEEEEEEELLSKKHPKNQKKKTKKKNKKKQKKKKKTKTPPKIKAPPGCEGTVVIIRHCEKGLVREHCDYLGYERAAFLATQFGDDVNDRWPSPSYLFSLSPDGRHHAKKRNVREIETIQPLADKFNLTADVSFNQDQSSKLSQKIFNLAKSGELCGKVAVISWKHSEIPHLATKLGCGPKEGCPSDYSSTTFDMTVQIKYSYGKLLHSTEKNGKVDKKHYQWFVYGSTVNQGFDPLKFSKRAGDYVKGGTSFGARWMPDVDFVEMKRKKVVMVKPSLMERIGE